MDDASVEEARTVLTLSPAERDDRGITRTEVAAALRTVMADGGREAKVLEGCTLPRLEFDYETLEGATNHPVVFEDCTIDAVTLDHAEVSVPVRFVDCTIDGLSMTGAVFDADVTIEGTAVTGPVDGVETRFRRDATFQDTTFAEPVTFDEASFGDDTSFEDVALQADASFRGASFSGTSNDLEDNADFGDTVFGATADFRQATFGAATFEDAVFEAEARFQDTRFRGDVLFTGVSFRGEADFDETRFREDATFTGATFDDPSVFRGAVFEGGARTIEDDAAFEEVTFHDSTNFRSTKFRYVSFHGATFEGHAMFEEAVFDADADFVDVTFAAEADFDEARFDGDADYSNSRFEAPAVFRGAVFEGEAKHLEMNAVFADVEFLDEADFDNASFTSADFTGSRFGGVVDFEGAAFEHVSFKATSGADVGYVDFTDAVLKEGTITQPDGTWVRYDLTHASIGDVALTADRSGGERELLDYFRFCDTEFNEFDGYEFDFSAHTYYFDRNGWVLHTFDDPVDRAYAAPMTPEHVETTYLKAKNAASAGGYVKAAGEFRVQRQRHARQKHLAIARDAATETRSRLSNASRAFENYFLDISCGYGMRLGRILLVFLITPLLPAVLYTFGGQAFQTGAGQLSSIAALTDPAAQSILFKNIYFSYITFLTIGYGGIGPKGALARVLAGLEVYMSVVLGGLVLYALIKRSEL